LTDGHGHDEYAKLLGRFNPRTDTFNDGGVNQKLAEIKGYLEHSRRPRHPGEDLIELIGRYSGNSLALQAGATVAWSKLLIGYAGPLPEYILLLLSKNQ
jgi:hypothetical protein